MERAAKSKHRDWSQLIPDILDLIASRLSLDDYYRFGSVCTTWRHSTLSRSSYRQPLPWLLYPRSRTSKTEGFYCLHNKRFYQIPMPLIFRKCSWAVSSHGWVIMTNENYGNFLFNPFTGNWISLPYRHHSLPYRHQSQFNYAEWNKPKKIPYCIKAILSSEPTVANVAAGECVVAAILRNDEYDHYYNLIEFCRPGDQSWISCVIPYHDFDLEITNIIFSNDRKLYAITRCLHLYVFNIVDMAISWRKLLTHPPSNMKSEEQDFNNQLYLVESRGELLLIIRVMASHPETKYTKSFSIFKLDTMNDPTSWVRVEEIDRRIMFVGRSQPQSIELSGSHEFSGFERNCIYYADDDCDGIDNPNLEIGVFRLDGRSQEQLFRRDGISCIPNYDYYSCEFPSIWITPNP